MNLKVWISEVIKPTHYTVGLGTKTLNLNDTVCPKLFGTPKMYQNGPQMSNYCVQMPPHTGLYIHGWPQIQKSPYGYTQGPKFIVF